MSNELNNTSSQGMSVSPEQIAEDFKTQFGMSLEDFQQKVSQRVQSDAEFKKQFLSSPGSAARQLLESETNAVLPDNFEELFDKGVEAGKKEMNEKELSDEDLDQVAGGFAISACIVAAVITGGCAVTAAGITGGCAVAAATIAAGGAVAVAVIEKS